MSCRKIETSAWFATILLAAFLGQAHGQQTTGTGVDGILADQQNGTSSDPQTGNPLLNSFGQPRSSADSRQQDNGQQSNGQQDIGQQDSRQQDSRQQINGVNLQNAPEQDRTALDERRSAATSSRDLNQLPPDPPTEFQRLVQSSTGRMLPLYGSRLFRNAPSTFAPLDRVPVPLDYVIGPGDELLIQVWGQVTLNARYTVDRAGNIYVPQVGTVRVAGLPFAQLQSFLKAQMGRVFRNFDLNVNMGQLRSIQIFVVGQARRPGSYTVSSLSTLVDALFVTGGPTPQGSLRHIQLKRAGDVVVDFDLYDLLQRGDKSKDAPLLPGDVIYIPPVGLQVAIAGSVNAPAIYELKSTNSTVAEALALAAGPTSVASETRARLEHVDAHSMRSVTDLTLDQSGLSTTLRDGDILELAAVTDRFRNGVTLHGNVANPGHYAWKPGMRVGDLIPDRDALITRDYWLRRGRLGEPVLTYTPYCPRETTPAKTAETSPANTAVSGDCIPIPAAESLSPNDPRQSTGRIAPQSNSSAAASGSTRGTASAAVGRMEGEFQPRNDVTLSAPDIDWSYAVVERQDKSTLTTSLIPFNLGRLVLDGDASQNIELQPSDVVTIFSKADIRVPQTQQTRFVRLEGEFLSSGVYSVMPGETLQHLVARAGGLTSDAYLYGSEFTRESTRRIQQQRLNEYVDQISLQAGINAANSAGRNISAVDTAAAAALQGQNQNIISSLRQARASGRIVLNLQPDTSAASELPALSLENGDTFIVPHRPSTVSVAGAVYNPNTFLFEPGRRVGYYVGLAGGANHDADRKRAYVIRADGSVISKQQISSLRRNAFDSLHVYPGDTVIVPLNLNKGATLRNVVDIAQIFGQFGIALAAANVIF
ncbi:protein involved in polysaccharide export with SLBB domain [Granulicella aggregans]|uniref:Protein involved in polysaccharide export with SLBB domain n=1 Tax=Granulicella aggregans TaxID=474949 RepID=A0A7W8E2U3_9BACT|nr:SLBB domain-containing protein [Granulicella aggregans]MBB5057273.1 protein involved in polysaccharide export with SLBB domain [Granulicella aggregans]